MGQLVARIDLSSAPTAPQVIPGSVGTPITGVIVNGTLPAGVTFKVMQSGQPSGPILGGASSPTGGGDALLDYWCPPLTDGVFILWTPSAPGQSVELILTGPGAGASLSRP